jgi:thiol:disulfide interchange protein DsbD
MGSALGLTLNQPAALLIAVLSAIGIGMALPYWVLTQWPWLARRLPKPGRWMVSLRQALAFPMYATVAWLVWVLALQRGDDAVLRFGFAAVCAALAAWLWGRFVQPQARGRAIAAAATLVAAVAGIGLLWPLLRNDVAATNSAAAASVESPTPNGAKAASTQSAAHWQRWSPAAVEQERRRGRTVFVDFTAAWCISCQVNKKVVLDTASVQAQFDKLDVALFRADWTRADSQITAELAALGRNGVPVYVVYRAGNTAPILLPEILSPSIVIDAVAGGK